MANRYFAILEVGGTVTVEQLRQIIALAQEEEPESIEVPPALLPHVQDTEGWPKPSPEKVEVGYVRVSGVVRWGQFEDLEAYLQAQQIPYDRFTESGGGWDAVLVRFRPDRGVREDMVNVDGEPFIGWKALERAIAETRTREELVDWLRQYVGADVPALPPLTLTDRKQGASPASGRKETRAAADA